MSLMKRILERLEDEERRKRNRLPQTDEQNKELRIVRKFLLTAKNK